MTAAMEAAGKSSLWRDPELEVALTWRREENPTAAWADLYGGGFEVSGFILARKESGFTFSGFGAKDLSNFGFPGVIVPEVFAVCDRGGYREDGLGITLHAPSPRRGARRPAGPAG